MLRCPRRVALARRALWSHHSCNRTASVSSFSAYTTTITITNNTTTSSNSTTTGFRWMHQHRSEDSNPSSWKGVASASSSSLSSSSSSGFGFVAPLSLSTTNRVIRTRPFSYASSRGTTAAATAPAADDDAPSEGRTNQGSTSNKPFDSKQTSPKLFASRHDDDDTTPQQQKATVQQQHDMLKHVLQRVDTSTTTSSTTTTSTRAWATDREKDTILESSGNPSIRSTPLPRISRSGNNNNKKKKWGNHNNNHNSNSKSSNNNNANNDALGRMLEKVLAKSRNDPKQSPSPSETTPRSPFASTLQQRHEQLEQQQQLPNLSRDRNNHPNETTSSVSSSSSSATNKSSSSSLDVAKLRNALYRRSPDDHGGNMDPNNNNTFAPAFPIPRPDMTTPQQRHDTLPKTTTVWSNPPPHHDDDRKIPQQLQQQPQQDDTAKDASPSLSTSDDADWTSSLTEYIRSMTLKHEAESAKKLQQQQQQEQEKSFFSSSLFLARDLADFMEHQPLPKWRLVKPMRRRDQRKQDRVQSGQKKSRMGSLKNWAASLGKKTHEDQNIHHSDNKKISQSQPILLPNHDISLTEASLLFREKAISLRQLLVSLGELSLRDSTPEEDIMCSPDLLELMALEWGLSAERSDRPAVARSDQERLLQRRAAAEESHDAATMHHRPYESLPPRPPVVCIMGHVDHGKTTLMDALRNRSLTQPNDETKKKKGKKNAEKSASGGLHTNVAGTEAGGITQVISAFQVPLVREESEGREATSQENDVEVRNAVTFLDTPGHAAFRAMRQSGSDAADIIVLVIAADDGVSEQTVEIIDFYKSIVEGAGSGGISLVVAMNKIDKPGVDVEESRRRIEMQLLEHGILTEGMHSSDSGEFGQPVQLVPVSGLKGHGLDDLIEALTLQADVMDLRADHDATAEGIVMDARVDKGLGVVADCIIRWGTLEKGDIVVSGTHWGRVRLLQDVTNNIISKGLPSQPVRLIGFDSVPRAGEPLVVVESEEAAADLIARRKALEESDEPSQPVVVSEAEIQSSGRHMMTYQWSKALEEKHGIESDDKDGPIRIPVVVKADADGTLVAVRDALIALREESTLDIVIDPVKVGVGPVQASDIQIAKEGGAAIICFNVKNDNLITSLAEEEGISLVTHNVIYSLLDGAKTAFAKFLPARPVEVVHGRGKVKAVYDIGGIDEKVAGLEVTEGTIYRDKTKGKDGALKCQFRVIRGNEALPSCESLSASSLKHFKEDVTSVAKGKECGLSLSGHSNYEEGDVIECFSIEMKQDFV